jgi:hypothetical protein
MDTTVRFRPAVPALVILIAVFLAGAGSAGFAQAITSSIDGTVASLSASQITLTAADGSTKVATLSPGTLVLERRTATLGDIMEGDALGVAAHRAADGTMTADGINIFSPELYKVVRKGQFPMQQPGEIMTNAEVASYAAKTEGHSLSMKYNGETYMIAVPDGADIHRLVTVQMSALKEGMHVLVRGSQGSDGSFKAAVVSFDG